MIYNQKLHDFELVTVLFHMVITHVSWISALSVYGSTIISLYMNKLSCVYLCLVAEMKIVMMMMIIIIIIIIIIITITMIIMVMMIFIS